MLPINNYTISGLESLKRFPNMEVAQFTLNGRIWPGKRKTVEALRSVRDYHKSKVLVHYDFIYIISRYAMFSQTTKNAVLHELIDIMNYARFDKTIIGIVMHMDWSLKKGITDSTEDSKIADSYQGTVWDTQTIPDLIKGHYNQWIEFNLRTFYNDLIQTVPANWKPGCKIYLENTTKVGPAREGYFPHLACILQDNPEYQNYFGLTYDTEHHYALTGDYLTPANVALELRDKGIDCIVHLNTIPEEVRPMSGKDRHSETTVFECSVFSSENYRTMAWELVHNNIPFVREVKEDAMFREMKQMQEKWVIQS